MLTNTDWLKPGSIYPPPSEKKRLDSYVTSEKLFLSEHAEALSDYFYRIAQKTRKRKYDVETVINYHQLLSKKTADFVCGEPPEIETEQNTDELEKILKAQNWSNRLYESFIDVSRFGNAVLKIVGTRLTAVSPLNWFPVVEPSDLKTITQHVIAYPQNPDDKGVMRQLYAELHTTGKIETRVYEYDGNTGRIGTLISSGIQSTGLDDFAVAVLTNVTHSGSIYGLDDYNIINSIIAKLIWRIYCIDNVLDKHSDPSISGPRSALSYDEHHKAYFLDLGNYFARTTSDEPDINYITWDGNLDAAYKEVELLLNQLYSLSEMGQAFIEGGGGGEASSGTALKLRMVSPRIKAARLAKINDSTVKRIILTLAKINGVKINPDTLTLHWSDGLPDDEVEQINTLVTATGNKPVMSQYTALKKLGLSDEETEAELEQIKEETAAAAPALLSPLVTDDDNGTAS